jgi:hypothetical protein
MSKSDELPIPPPPVVREVLAQKLREAAILRRQFRLSVTPAQKRQAQSDRHPVAARPEGVNRA